MGRVTTPASGAYVLNDLAKRESSLSREGEDVLTTRLDSLASLKDGWNGLGSRSLDAASATYFREFVNAVTPSRMPDAYPILTDEGYVRLEWEAEGHSYSAEIGPSSLYMCDLAPDPSLDADIELDHYDRDRLVEFFLRGFMGDR